MPALESARKRAFAVGCLANLRQQGMGFHFFGQDFESCVPTAFNCYMPEAIGRYVWSPYERLCADAPGNGYIGYSGQGTAYYTATIPYNQLMICPAVPTPAGDNNDPLGCAPNSAYIHYGIGMWTTYYYGFAKPPAVGLYQFGDMNKFMRSTWETTNPDFFFTRQFLKGGIYVGTTYVPTSNFCLSADDYAYWFLNGARAADGTPTGYVRYRHFDKANALLLDMSAKPVYLLSNYGWEVLKEDK